MLNQQVAPQSGTAGVAPATGAPSNSSPAKGESHVGEILGGTAVILAVALAVAWSRRAANTRYAIAVKVFGAALAVTVISGGVMIATRPDKAAPDLKSCQEDRSKGWAVYALQSCEKAVAIDPESKAGREAAALLPDLRVAAEKQKDTEAAKKKQEEEASAAKYAAEAPAREAARQALLRRVHRNRNSAGDDGCAGMSKPPVAYFYGGASFAQNEEVAREKGCVPRQNPSTRDIAPDNQFCCPD